MFTTFREKLPEYEVITPQTKLSFNIKSLNVFGEENLKGSFVVSVKMIEHLNRCIYDSITSFPDSIKSYEDFLSKVTTVDREALLYGLYHITYDEIRNYDVICASCDTTYNVTVSSSDIFSICMYPGTDDILKKMVPVTLPVFKSVVPYIKQPSLQQEYEQLKSFSPMLGKNTGIVNDILIIDRFEELDDAGAPLNSWTRSDDIMDAYRSLSPKDKRTINKEYEENFGKYSVELKMKPTCTKCGHVEEVTIDLVSQFFRMVYTVR
jgi:hypothetical protein